MDHGVIQRTQYWNPALPNTVRTGASTHAESLADLERYLLVQERARGAGLFTWGVTQGLQVAAVPGAADVTVRPGVALDVSGRTVTLAPQGLAVVEATLDPQQVLDVPTVVVEDNGVALPTAGAPADCLLTLSWREVGGTNSLANAPALLHAPWLRLLPAVGFEDDGDRIVLAALTLDAGGLVQALSAGPRRAVGLPAGHLTLSRARASGAGPAVVDQVPAARLAVGPGGDVILSRLDGAAAPAPLLTLAPGGDAGISGTLTVAGAAVVAAGASVGGALSVAGPAAVTADASVGGTLTVAGSLAVAGPVSVGQAAGPSPAMCTLRVEGQEVHTGGAMSGYSFADRAAAFVADPGTTGQRWLWYAQDGTARLWSGDDLVTASRTLEGGGLDVRRRMRVRQGGDASAGIWLLQSTPNSDRAFMGMADDNHVGLWGNTGANWGLWMHTHDGNVGIGIPIDQAPGGRLHVNGFIAVRAAGAEQVGGGQGPFGHRPFLFGVGVDASGGTGVRARGSLWAGDFQGDVRVSGTLSKGGGGFMIDHPLDPANRYLSHSFVESPDMLNVYAGSVTTGPDGTAEITMPDYFEALNGDLTYQLTPVGGAAVAWVAREVSDGRFRVATDPAGTRVCWLVTGVRQDPWARANRIVPEHAKPGHEVDLYLHPEAHGVAAHRRVGTDGGTGGGTGKPHDDGGMP